MARALNRKEGIQRWRNTFQQLQEEGEYTGTKIDKELIRFCFTAMVQVGYTPILII